MLEITEVFKNYTSQRGFELYFCRKANPGSKGKAGTTSDKMYQHPFTTYLINQ